MFKEKIVLGLILILVFGWVILLAIQNDINSQNYNQLRLANVKLNYLISYPTKNLYIAGDDYCKQLNEFLIKNK